VLRGQRERQLIFPALREEPKVVKCPRKKRMLMRWPDGTEVDAFGPSGRKPSTLWKRIACAEKILNKREEED